MSPPNSLRRLYRLQTSSPQFPAQIATILDGTGTEYRASIKTLKDGDLARLIEYLENVCFCIILILPIPNHGVGSPYF